MVSVITSISIPLSLLNEIDESRGRVSRSKFCLGLIQQGLKQSREEN